MSAILNLSIMIGIVFLYVGTGTVFFHLSEGVSYVDALFWASSLKTF
jgi:hypothetical protein